MLASTKTRCPTGTSNLIAKIETVPVSPGQSQFRPFSPAVPGGGQKERGVWERELPPYSPIALLWTELSEEYSKR